MARIASRLQLALVALAMAAGLAEAQVIPPTAPPTRAPVAASRLADVRSWGYQLQRVDVERVERSPYDLVVVDYSHLGTDSRRFSREEVARMQKRPDGSRRLVLAYMSIGEAEDYRYYWRPEWVDAINVLDDPATFSRSYRALPPAIERGTVRLRTLRLPTLVSPPWLGRENESWTGNFLVRFWDPGWQAIIHRGADSYLERILKAGFDGVYLDRVDAFQAIAEVRPQAQGEMVRLVLDIAETARRRRPGFIVVPQNGEQLLADAAYLAAIDGIAKEDLLYGEERDGAKNSLGTVSRSMRWLAPAMNRGLPVMVIEYVEGQPLVDIVKAEVASRGFMPYVGPRTLDRLLLPEDYAAKPPPALTAPAAAPAAAPAQPQSTRTRTPRRPGGVKSQ
jgi:cysteinyl-tRNA synthetase